MLNCDTDKLMKEHRARMAAQPVQLDSTTADDMAVELTKRKELLKLHEEKVAGYEGQLEELTTKWQKLNAAIAAAEKLLAKRPSLRTDIASWKREMESIEDDGNRIKPVLEGHRRLLKQSKNDLKQLSENNPRGFDYEKYERLKKEEEDINKLSVR